MVQALTHNRLRGALSRCSPASLGRNLTNYSAHGGRVLGRQSPPDSEGPSLVAAGHAAEGPLRYSPFLAFTLTLMPLLRRPRHPYLATRAATGGPRGHPTSMAIAEARDTPCTRIATATSALSGRGPLNANFSTTLLATRSGVNVGPVHLHHARARARRAGSREARTCPTKITHFSRDQGAPCTLEDRFHYCLSLVIGSCFLFSQ